MYIHVPLYVRIFSHWSVHLKMNWGHTVAIDKRVHVCLICRLWDMGRLSILYMSWKTVACTDACRETDVCQCISFSDIFRYMSMCIVQFLSLMKWFANCQCCWNGICFSTRLELWWWNICNCCTNPRLTYSIECQPETFRNHSADY